jgi:hypothetical protein
LRVHVGDQELVEVLLDYFRQESDCVAIQVGESEIEVSLLGSYGRKFHDEKVAELAAEFRRRKSASPRRAVARLRNGADDRGRQ